MKKRLLVVLLFWSQILCAQEPAPERLADFTVEKTDKGYQFAPNMPALQQKPGAPEAHWSYFWEFGDGTFSRAANPVHVYAREGDFLVHLDATAHYDDGKKAKKKKKPLHGGGQLADVAPDPEELFPAKNKQMVTLYSYAQPRATEELTFVLRYRNLGKVPTNGQLHLFYNEKRYPATHFDFVEYRSHFGEKADFRTSQLLPADDSDWGWTQLQTRPEGSQCTDPWGDFPPSVIVEEMLQKARGLYRDEQQWQFADLEPGAARNLFVSLLCTPNMLRDTNAMIHLEVVFAPEDPLVPPESFVYEIEIVGSHDPNAIAVSDNRVNYRVLGNKKLDYKIQFQNNGEGPASTVSVAVESPKGLKIQGVRPLDWYPRCPICPKTPTNLGCLDTTTVDGRLQFTFRNIYLPGSRQNDVQQRDSTKGFVKYRIEAERNMPKRPFRSRAKIVFDKNPPIYTNYTNTRFKVGLSPGLKAGYSFDPETPDVGYTFLGASISPYKSWRWYPQLELLTGLKGRTDEPVVVRSAVLGTLPNNGIALLDSVLVDTTTRRSQGFVSLELPVLLRKNFNRWFGAGLGASARLIWDNGLVRTETTRSRIDWSFQDTPTGVELKRNFIAETPLVEETAYRDTRVQYTFFADLTLGAVRAGPSLGIRGGVSLLKNAPARPFVQLSLELKL
jgi:hypothetical protein